MTKAEEIYHRFVNYEWNEIGEGMQKSIIKAIEEALKEGQKLPIHNVSQQSELLKVLSKHIAEVYELNEGGVLKNMEHKLKNL
jgi:formiminotetrahydrofolate cyclodeaminase